MDEYYTYLLLPGIDTQFGTGVQDVVNVRNWYNRCTSSMTVFFLVELLYLQYCGDGLYEYAMVSLLLLW